MSMRPYGDRGFTLVELMLAMVFLSSILLISTSVIIQAFSIYNKGLAVRQINQLGRTLTEDMTRAANSGNVVIDSAGSNAHVLCLGATVYVWNTVAQTRSAEPKPVKKFVGLTDELNLVKVNGGECTSDEAVEIDRNIAIDMLSDQVRVLSADVSQVADSNLVNITFVFGTYDSDPNSSVNPRETVEGNGIWQCPASGLGNYCAFGVYTTTLYLPNSNEQT